MAISKIILNGVTQMDLTSDTVAANNLISPNTAHDAAGLAVVGTASGGSVEDKFITVTFNNHLETSNVSLFYATSSTLINSSSGYVEMITTSSIAVNSTMTRLMPYGFGLAVRTTNMSSANTQNFELRMNNVVIEPVIEGKSGNTYYKYYKITKDNLDSSNNVIDFYSILDPFKDTVLLDTLSATVNGTYTATSGTAYSEVVVNVPSGSPNLQSKSATPTESTQTVTADSGYDGLSSVEVGAISSTYVGSGITRRSSSDLTASWSAGTFTINAPAGYYESAASRAVSNGTVTPIATKGTVSNHSVSVTPSVDKIAGYITAGTTSGTAVTVTASELVSGTYTVDSSGTKDVTNYASASVPAGTAGTPSATKGTVSNHSVSVTPSVTNTTGWITGGSKSGTAVTVTASELASGNKAIVDNGTNIDVVGYSTVSVAVPFSTITVSSSNPTGGSNGDIWIKTS